MSEETAMREETAMSEEKLAQKSADAIGWEERTTPLSVNGSACMNDNLPVFTRSKNGPQITLHNADSVPTASGFLWNPNMLLNMSCHGYANVHFMQPEPATYSSGPALEAKTFLQPEHQYYPGHPGRFFYFRDKDSNAIFSAPYAPCNVTHEQFEFCIDTNNICWKISNKNWDICLSVTLPQSDIVELWQLTITNKNKQSRTLNHFPCFNIGNQSWMNQSATFNDGLNAIIADKVTPYQKTEDYEKQKSFMEKTFFASDTQPDSWTSSLKGFLGKGDWRYPDGLRTLELPQQNAVYESPIASMQFEQNYHPHQTKCFRYIFGPAKNLKQIAQLAHKYLSDNGFENAANETSKALQDQQPAIQLQSPDQSFDHFVNHWLSRQVRYHSDTKRLTTDPQTRNFLQDAMGMSFMDPEQLRIAIVTTLSQQLFSGEIPDGVLLNDQATLKYINQVPHSDHAVWIPLCLTVYLSETNDLDLLQQKLPYSDCAEQETAYQHIERALRSLEENLDERNLSLIHQGDWCDPMNMVGHKGIGVSAWLTMATSWCFQEWANVCEYIVHSEHTENDSQHTENHYHKAVYWRQKAQLLNDKINRYFWDGDWYARGITDQGRKFGSKQDIEGKIFLNPQSWALLCGAASVQQQNKMHNSVNKLLRSQYGVTMLAPAYTNMQEDIGRLTQKYPGVAENGSIYCHAVAFYIYALWKNGEADYAFELLKVLISSEDNCERHGQLPVFIPNYYRGAPEQHPEHCGRSSRLFNTGTIAWVMRTIIEEMCGLKGNVNGLSIAPKIPRSWDNLKAARTFRNKRISLSIVRKPGVYQQLLWVNGQQCADNHIHISQSIQHYEIVVHLPLVEAV